MSDYTPTTKEVREAYAVHRFNAYAKYREVGLPEFDRWLAAHDKEVQHKGWEIGFREASENGRPEATFARVWNLWQQAEDAIAQVRAIHVATSPDSEGREWCIDCADVMPCMTLQALPAARVDDGFRCEHVGCVIVGTHEHISGVSAVAVRGDGEQA